MSVNRPYLTPELDEHYNLSQSKDGCFGMFGKPVLRGTHIGRKLIFRQISFYPTGQAEGGPAIEISMTLDEQYRPLMQEISRGYLATWLNNLPESRLDLVEKFHNFGEYWKVKNTQLSVTIVWYYEEPDWTILPDVVDRLIHVAEVIEARDT